MDVTTHVKMPEAEHIVTGRYCRGMPISRTTVPRQTVCELHCVSTPGCLFYNYKRESVDGPFLCDYADPLDGVLQTTAPVDQTYWTVNFM